MFRFRWMGALAALVLMVAGGAFVLPARAESANAAPALAANRLEADLSKRELYVYLDGELMSTFPIAVGEEGQETPTGDFTIDRIIWNPGWIPPDVEWAAGKTEKEPGDPENPMRGAKLYFAYPDYYIHGTSAPETMGEAASKGCLRMTEVDVENLAEFVQKSGGEDRSDGWFQHVRASNTDKREITLSDPVPINIHW